MLVRDPTRGNNNNNLDDIFDQARQVAVDAPPENPRSSSRSRSFSGTARLLSGETVPSAPQRVEEVTHTVIFWRNGFSVNDGPLRRLDDPQNAPFLEVVCHDFCFQKLLFVGFYIHILWYKLMFIFWGCMCILVNSLIKCLLNKDMFINFFYMQIEGEGKIRI